MFKVGDRVKLTFKPSITGKVIEVRVERGAWFTYGTDKTKYLVTYDDKDYIPTKDWYHDYEIEKIELPPVAFFCECGADSAGTAKHSKYCPKYKISVDNP